MRNQITKGGESKMTNTAILYCRVASSQEHKIFPESIRQQLLECVRFAQRNGYYVLEIICERRSNGLKGNEVLLNMLKRYKCTLITRSPDRLSRDSQLLKKTIEEVKNFGGDIKFLSEDEADNNVLERNILTTVQDYYRRHLNKKIKNGISVIKNQMKTAQPK